MNTPLGRIAGKWPGDETDEQIAEGLASLQGRAKQKMAQTAGDKCARVRTMLFDDGDTWDLSPNDKEALAHVLGMVNALASEVAEYKGTTVPDVIDSCNELVELNEYSRSSHCSPAKACDFVYELELAVSFVTDECRLANPVEVSHEMRDGEGYIRVEPSMHHMLHRLWSSCVDKPGYDKEAWREIERQLKVAGIVQ